MFPTSSSASCGIAVRLAIAACVAVVLAVFAAPPTSAAFGIVHSFGFDPVSARTAEGQLSDPYAIATDPAGNVYVADTSNDRIQKFSSAGVFLRTWGSRGAARGEFSQPKGIAFVGGDVYVADTGNDRIQRFSPEGEFLGTFGGGGSGPGQFVVPRGMAGDAAGVLYVADQNNDRVQTFRAGAYVAAFGASGSGKGQLKGPSDVAVDAAGNVYVVDKGNHRIQKFDAFKQSIATWGSEGAGDGQFKLPGGVAVDAAGIVYVADSNNHRFQKFSAAGEFLGKFGGPPLTSRLCEGQFSHPQGVDVDGSGRVYVSDTGHHRIQVFGEGGAPIPRCPGTTATVPPLPAGTPPPPRVGGSAAVAVLSGLSLSRRVFCVGRECPRARRGTLARFALAAPARVEFKLERRVSGRRADGRCGRATRRNRGGPRCDYYADAGSFSKLASAGANSVAFSGRIGGRALRPGSYRLSLTAISATGARSTTQRVRFRVQPPNPARPGSGR